MNDPFEERLRALRPSALPGELRERLAQAPAVSTSPGRLLAFLMPFAAAACLALFLAWPSPVSAQGSVLVSTLSQEVTGVRPISLITDEANRPWEFVEVSWVEESTLVSSGSPVALQIRDLHRAVASVAAGQGAFASFQVKFLLQTAQGSSLWQLVFRE